MLLGCGSTGTSSPVRKDLTMADFIKTFADAGIKEDAEKKPFFTMIGAKDGVGFGTDENPKAKIVIYEYNSNKDLDQAKKDFVNVMKDWPINGMFVLESSDDKASEIFKNLK